MTRSGKGNDFSRIKPATANELDRHAAPRDHEGRRALFSAASPVPEVTGVGSVAITCSDCGVETVLSPGVALRHAVPSLHLPFIKRGHGSWMRCPACGKRRWVSVHITLP